MRSVHIPRLELSVRGIDEATIATALEALPGTLSAELVRAQRDAGPAAGPLRFASAPSARALADGIAERVAHEIRSGLPTNRKGA